MEEQLISFELAKFAKEKGFNEKTKSVYDLSGDVTNFMFINLKWNKIEYIAAPTQSFLQKWLREVHGIYVESYHDYDPKDKGFQFYTNWGFHNPDTIEKKQSGWYDEYNDWKVYEDALEFGLQEGLKMIK